ncbi:MAG: hypothetical protein CL466_07775 [Acidimicrobiaceae bacterium]|nr:hypothetical protein [Acidimicrobiaceae bacterium]
MSQECRRVIKDNGLYVFSVIALPDGLSSADYQLGLEYGPADVEVDGGYVALLDAAGWVLEDRIDLTPAYITAIDRLRTEEESHFGDLADMQGAEVVEARIARRTKRLKALELGVVIREQFVARPA